MDVRLPPVGAGDSTLDQRSRRGLDTPGTPGSQGISDGGVADAPQFSDAAGEMNESCNRSLAGRDISSWVLAVQYGSRTRKRWRAREIWRPRRPPPNRGNLPKVWAGQEKPDPLIYGAPWQTRKLSFIAYNTVLKAMRINK